ncbi:similar to Saccharomyces cerevisiae FLO5 YHR211W Lectin-like cell wall protein (flocculin) involved in flocculation [Maudiozyma saulgeensis]|uniref:Similar to Saccharomyces cerevisiae FLO5 YHR211W Lectin-like cell wall protein (Flocculin) involved in flocculation n=1 Tax=Maudiozyma saulgeensis TaxID=1789683 RepID=A0A1X7QWF4_9SACH|nr:similar to Saccharomyces cerevisiae FLO5 YHR211W Lectin-like cell wall protein (flocculin) involved in flocculation [Kazachstania saulgeensis]
MKFHNNKIQLFSLIIAQLINYCYARTCSNANLTFLNPYASSFSGSFLVYTPQASGQTTYDYILDFLVDDGAPETDSFYGITDINYEMDVDDDSSDNTATLFGRTINVSNFTVKASGLFYPKISGNYNFEISADDAAILSVRSHYDYYCCHNFTIDASDPIGFYKTIYEDFTDLLKVTGSPDDVTTKTIYLTAGAPVLLLMTSINRSGGASFNMKITDPNGDIISDLTDYLYENKGMTVRCHTEVDILESASVQSSTTYSTVFYTTTAEIFGIKETQTTYYVKVPETMSLSSSSVVESSSSIVSSSTVSSEPSSSVVSSSTQNEESSTSLVSSSTANSIFSSSIITSSSPSSNPLSITESSSNDSSSESASTILSVTTSADLSSSVISSSTSIPDTSSSSVAYSSLNSGESSIFTYSSTDNGGQISSTTSITTLSSQSSSTGIINEISSSLEDFSTSSAYTYSNSSTVKSTASITSKPILGSSEVIQSTEGDSNLGQKTSVTVPCTSENCQKTSTQSTEYITKTSIITSTIVTECSVTDHNSIELVLSTYVTEITTVATITSCPGGCSIEASKTTNSKASGTSVVQETEETSEAPIKQGTSTVSMKQETSRAPSIQETSKSQGTSSSSYVVELNENSSSRSMFDFAAIFISIISGFFIF